MMAGTLALRGIRPTQTARPSRPSSSPHQLRLRAPARTLRYHTKLTAVAAAAEAEEVVEDAEEIDEEIEEEDISEDTSRGAGKTEVWAAERLARLEAGRVHLAEEPRYALNFLWLDKNIGVAVDQVFAKGQRSPVTDYFFWPRRDAWEELKASLESKTWIGERDRVLLLNQTTEVINYWQEGEKKMLDQARQAFPDAKFQGS